jgi:hypothetical protein
MDLSGTIKKIDFSEIAFLTFGETYHYTRDLYPKNQWYEPVGRGLCWQTVNTGTITGSWADENAQVSVHACGFNGKLCAFLHTDFFVEPLVTKMPAHPTIPYRAGALEIGLNVLPFQIRSQKLGKISFSVVFTGDINGDGNADENDYQLKLKQFLPAPYPLYQNAFWYKIMNDNAGTVYTTYNQSLEIIKAIHKMTGGAKQIVYLTGWQYEGHDTGYPSFDKINERLGTYEEFLSLIQTAYEQYNCVVSLHINTDDTYEEHPGFNSSIVSRDIDGNLMKWEVFNGKQSYHISHTKDVESGEVFKRFDALLALLPIRESIHIDAMRSTNFSWEPDGFIGALEEAYCGIVPILTYFKEKGIDVTTEALNGTIIEPAAIYSGLFHNSTHFPVLYHHQLFGGGRGTHPKELIIGSDVDKDIVADMLGNGQLVRLIAMFHLLSRFLSSDRRCLVFYNDDGSIARAKYDDQTIAIAYSHPDRLDIRSGATLIADNDTRFIPLTDGIYTYSETGQRFQRVLPLAYQGRELAIEYLFGEGGLPLYQSDDTSITLTLPARTLYRLIIRE